VEKFCTCLFQKIIIKSGVFLKISRNLTSFEMGLKIKSKNNFMGQDIYQYIVEKALHDFNPKKIILFGSRARGNFKRTSDIDIAFEFDALTKVKEWAYFCTDIEENAPILLNFDLVNLNEASTELKKNIFKEGKVLFER